MGDYTISNFKRSNFINILTLGPHEKLLWIYGQLYFNDH